MSTLLLSIAAFLTPVHVPATGDFFNRVGVEAQTQVVAYQHTGDKQCYAQKGTMGWASLQSIDCGSVTLDKGVELLK